MDALTWVRDWFRERGAVPPDGEDFFRAGYLDSLDSLELIVAIEAAFDIRLNARQFRDRRFSTVDGLAQIIGEASGD